jgi:uncharacterized radical SAM superfamily Fe-S cluster-containing enzyme
MDCTTCTPTPARKDRLHTFLAHEYAACPACGARVEGRVVLRDGKVKNLLRCPSCGPQELAVAEDAGRYLEEFLARGRPPEGHRGDWVFKRTTSTCPTCLALLEADVVVRDEKVYFKKTCSACGPSEALVSEDARYYVQAYAYARAGTEPLEFTQEAARGCPTDCGTCSDHEQHTCLPIIEVTDHCNLECPICIVDNQYSSHMEVDVFSRTVDRLIRAEGRCESVAICGGEPTSHPRLFELIRAADRPEIGRVVLITNGLRIGRDRGFAQQIKDSGAYVALQLDGFDAESHRVLRGRDLTEEKASALRTLRELRIPTQLIFVAARGVNEHQIGRAVDLLLSEDHILSLNFQPLSLTGNGGGRFQHDPMDRLTIPGVIRAVEEQTGGRIRKSDFSPLPCSHPQCVSLTYLLRLNDGSYLPFPRFVDFKRHGNLLRSSATLPATAEMHDTLHEVIHDVYATETETERGTEVLAALRRALDVMFPNRPVSQREELRIGEQQAKSIFLHQYMDPHDFDLERLRKCCHHYTQADGRIMPACGFNLFHRGAAKGPGTAVPAWAKNAPHGSGTAGARLRVVT